MTKNQPKCEICGERIGPDQMAEMYDPHNPEAESVVCHADCGLWKNLEVA
jgi:hypothetical protein